MVAHAFGAPTSSSLLDSISTIICVDVFVQDILRSCFPHHASCLRCNILMNSFFNPLESREILSSYFESTRSSCLNFYLNFTLLHVIDGQIDHANKMSEWLLHLFIDYCVTNIGSSQWPTTLLG